MSTCFDLTPSVEEVPLKNTFVHFDEQSDEPRRARRATCAGRFLAEKRRRSVVRGNPRSATAPAAPVAVAVPRDEAWRALVDASEPPACPPAQPAFNALRPPPVSTAHGHFNLTGPSPVSFCPTWSPCSTPPMSPCMPVQQWAYPCSPPASPCSQATVQWSYPTMCATPPMSPSTPQCVWQMLNEPIVTEEPKKRARNRKQKQPVIPARPNEMTLMLRMLPVAYSPGELQDKFSQFLPFIDFYYLPTNFETKKNLGYAFVNFTDQQVAREFAEFWEQSGIAETDDKSVVDARVQGYAENVERFRNSSVMPVLAEELKPRIFCKGAQVPFPQGDGEAPPVGPRFRPTGQ